MPEDIPVNTLLERAYMIAGGAAGGVANLVGKMTRRPEWRERLGFGAPLPGDVRPLWFHGASVGELATLRPLVAEIRDRLPGLHWGVSTTTTTGRSGARTQFPDALFHRLLPLDAWPATGRFLDAVHPGALVIVETELWPRLLLSLAGRRVPVCLASARLTHGSLGRYRRAVGLFRGVVAGLDLIATRSEEDRRRFLQLGAHPDRTVVLGNTKLDALDGSGPALAPHDEGRLAHLVGERHLVVWGCLRPGEESLAAGAMRSLAERASVFWVLAPRHLPDFERTARWLEQAGIPFVRWSRADEERTDAQVLLLDTLGELRAFYARADVAVVGGTFGGHGGHNLMEPAMFGVPVIFGRDTSSWPDDAERLLRLGGGLRVHGPDDLVNALWETLTGPEARARLGAAARDAAAEGRGASRRVVDALAARDFFAAVTRVAETAVR